MTTVPPLPQAPRDGTCGWPDPHPPHYFPAPLGAYYNHSQLSCQGVKPDDDQHFEYAVAHYGQPDTPYIERVTRTEGLDWIRESEEEDHVRKGVFFLIRRPRSTWQRVVA